MNPLPEPSDEELLEIESEQEEVESPEPDESLAELDDLVAAAICRILPRDKIPAKASRRAAPAGVQRLDSLYKDPANWRPTRNITLVHQSESVATLVGTFLEFYHVKIHTARKLIASAPDATLPTAVEYVSDPWYIERQQRPIPSPTRTMLFGIDGAWELDGGLRTGKASLSVHAVRGEGIARVEFISATRFASENGRTILYLPAGLDILEGLTKEGKLAIKAEFDRLSA